MTPYFTKQSFILKSLILIFLLLEGLSAWTQGVQGYYRFPSLHKETIIFAAEGDLWSVPIKGGVARRLTTHPGEESHPEISPDGQTIAFSATYEGPTELFTMPINGGLPERWSYQRPKSRATASCLSR